MIQEKPVLLVYEDQFAMFESFNRMGISLFTTTGHSPDHNSSGPVSSELHNSNGALSVVIYYPNCIFQKRMKFNFTSSD